jgi:hypothetical protein
MKSFSVYLTEQIAKGDCLYVAGQVVLFMGLGGARDSTDLNDKLASDGATEKSVRLVHAFVTGKGKINGFRYVHAWVEHRGKVYDYSNNRKAVVSRDAYYMIGDINAKDRTQYRRYTAAQVRKKAVASGHWGPWDLDMSHEKLHNDTLDQGDPVSVWNEEVLEESVKRVFPKNMNEVGKHKLRLSTDILKGIK